MPSRSTTPLVGKVWATVHPADAPPFDVRVDGLMDLGVWPDRRDYRRRGIEAVGGMFDTTHADTVWAARQRAQARYDAAYAWWQGDTLGRDHPGGLEDYADDGH